MFVIGFAAGETPHNSCRVSAMNHCATLKDVREVIADLPEETPLFVYHSGLCAPVLEITPALFEKTVRISAGKFKKFWGENPMTVKQLRGKIRLLPEETKVVFVRDGQSAPIYGASKVTHD